MTTATKSKRRTGKASKPKPLENEQYPALKGVDLRQMIIDQLAKIGRSRYWLAHNGMVSLAPNSVMRYLNGTHDAHGQAIAQMMCAVGLKVEPLPGFAA